MGEWNIRTAGTHPTLAVLITSINETGALCSPMGAASIEITWSGLFWYRKLKRCSMVTHSSKSSLSGRACNRAANTWTQRCLRPICPTPLPPLASRSCLMPRSLTWGSGFLVGLAISRRARAPQMLSRTRSCRSRARRGKRRPSSLGKWLVQCQGTGACTQAGLVPP